MNGRSALFEKAAPANRGAWVLTITAPTKKCSSQPPPKARDDTLGKVWRGSDRERFKELSNFSVAVGEPIERNAGLVQQRQMKIRQRRRLRVLDVASALVAASATGNEDRQVG